jgi:uncharacterized membrane protein
MLLVRVTLGRWGMAVLGTQLRESAAGLQGSGADKTRVIIQIIISLALIGAGIYVILSNTYSEATQKIASGWVGLVVGYWLK